MGRRLLFDRDMMGNTDLVYGATDETGLQVDVPVEYSVQGQLRCDAGGYPEEVQDFYAKLKQSGNLGGAQFVLNRDPLGGNVCMGVNKSWVADRPQHANTAAETTAPVRAFRDVASNRVVLVYCSGVAAATGLSYRVFDPAAKTVGLEKSIGTITAGATACGVCLEDTGETVVFCDGALYSSFDPYVVSPTWIEKGVATGYTGGAACIWPSMAYIRGQLIVFYIEAGDVKQMVSYDRGATWETPVIKLAAGVDITTALYVSTALNPIDGNVYVVVVDDEGGGVGPRIRLYRTGLGVVWDEVNDDVGSYAAAAAITMDDITIACREDGGIVIGLVVGGVDSYIKVFYSGDFGVVINDSDNAFDFANHNVAGTTIDCESFQIVEGGDELTAFSMFDVTSHAIFVLGFRWWASVSEAAGYDQTAWFCSTLTPPTAFGFIGTIHSAIDDSYMTVETDAGTPTAVTGNIYGTGFAQKAKFCMMPVDYCDAANCRVGVRMRYDDGGGNGYDFGVYVDATGLHLYDHNGAVGSQVPGTYSTFFEFLIDLTYDAAGTRVTVYHRSTGTSYPREWEYVAERTVANGAGAATDISFGNFSFVAGQTTKSYWKFLMASPATEGADTSYANSWATPNSLEGKRCMNVVQRTLGWIDLAFRGAGGYFGDSWQIMTRYAWAATNVLLPDPKRQWRSDGDGFDKGIIFQSETNRQFRFDWIAIIGKNFDEFVFAADDAVTFDSSGGNPEYYAVVGDGAAISDNVMAYECPRMTVSAVDHDWIEVAAADGQNYALWAGRFDDLNARGKRFWVRVLTGAAAGAVYKVEAIRRPIAGDVTNWAIRLGKTAAGAAVNASGDGLAATHKIGIFGEDICFELGGFRKEGYRYACIQIPAQDTWDGDFRIGTVLFGVSVGLTSDRETKEPEWNVGISVAPNVGALFAPDGSQFRRRRGNAPRQVVLSWTGEAARTALQNPISAILEALAADTPVVFVEEDSLIHNGPSPPVVGLRTCYDPILCYAEGPFQKAMATMEYLTTTGYFDDERTGRRADVIEVVLSEIV
uniref:Uncharacterized protein n=1 Tax=viral metagenome TaxID=1070528 RepID=A0A6M3M5B9_9ZZZZ